MRMHTADLETGNAATETFLHLLWKPQELSSQGLWGLVEIEPDGSDRKWSQIGTESRTGSQRQSLDNTTNNIYFCPALFRTDGSRKRVNVAGSWVVWMDDDRIMDDEEFMDSLPVPPTIVIKSGTPGRHHAYWCLEYFEADVKRLEEANYALLKNTPGAYEADSSGWDVSQLLRPPTGVNTKHGNRPSIMCINPAAVYKIEDFLTLPHDADGPWCQTSTAGPSAIDWDGTLPDVEEFGLTGKPRDYLVNGCADRSEGRYAVINSLADMGKSENDMVGLLYQSPLGNYKSVEELEKEVARIMAKRKEPLRPPVIRPRSKLQLPPGTTLSTRTSWAGEPLADVLSGEFEPLTPTMMQCTNGVCLLYPGRSHSIAGESGGGKSLCAQAAVVQVLLSGGTVLYIDYESDAVSVVRERLADTFGVPHAVLLSDRFSYVSPDGKPSAAELQPLLDRRFDLVVVDGVTTSLSHWGLSGRSEDEVTLWNSEFIVPLQRSGAAVLMIDHVVKATDSRGSYAIGSQAKRSNLTGASYLARNVQPFGRGLRGVLELRLGGKDRPGQVQRHADNHGVVARFILDARAPQNPAYEFVSVSSPAGTQGFKVPDDGSWTVYAIEYIREHPGCSKRSIIQAMGSGGKVAKEHALNDLVTAGQITVRKAESKGLSDEYFLQGN
ncbi:hypothetical protein [Streptomyces gardneri]|uniref:hypothetical protein n=1 Tax=Streptomyces gardneri TaxID=66892 RepID=UPI0037D6EF73